MKLTFKFFFLLLFVGIALQSYSQKKPRSAYDTPVSSSYDKPTAAETKPVEKTKPVKTKGKKTTSSGVTASNDVKQLPIEVVEESQDGGLYGASKPSLRKDNILQDDTTQKEANPLPYTALYASDVMFRVRVWRTIDTRTQKNAVYFYNRAIDNNDNGRFINVLLKAIKSDSVLAFSGVDDRFTTPISFDEAVAGFGGGKDTVAKYDLDGNIVGYQVRSRQVAADSVYKYRIKEEWVFNKRDGKTYVRILGIAPVVSFTSSDGSVVPNSEHPVFWIYYPDIRKTLLNSSITNPLKMGGTVTWEEVFENRLFESNIIRSTLDAENGFDNYPLTAEQAKVIQTQLNSLSSRMWK